MSCDFSGTRFIPCLFAGVCPRNGVRAESDSLLLFCSVFGAVVGDLPKDHLLCPVQAVRAYLDLTCALSPRPRSLFVSPKAPSRSWSKKALSFFLRQVIVDANAFWEGASPRAHSIRGLRPLQPFCGTDWSPRCLRWQLGDRIEFLTLTFRIWLLLWTAVALWVRLWLLCPSWLKLFLSLVFRSWSFFYLSVGSIFVSTPAFFAVFGAWPLT